MGNENAKEHKLFFGALNKAKSKKEAERQALEQAEQERAAELEAALTAKEIAENQLEIAQAKWQKYEVQYEACRGALGKIVEQCNVPKSDDKQKDELDCRARLEIIRSIATVILEMQKPSKDGGK